MIIDWTLTGLIPTSGLLGWYLYNPNTSTGGNINDASGNGLHVVQASNAPTLVEEVLNGHPGWLFDGSTTNPLATSSSANQATQHIFVVGSHTDATFNLNRGLLSGKTSGDWITSETSGTQFFSFGADYTYRKSDTEYADDSMEAPMSQIPELIEMTNPTTVTLDGFQIGRQKDLDSGARKWKGYFHEALIYNRVLTTNERRRVMLYMNIKFGCWSKGVPLYFPSADLLTGTGIVVPTRFLEVSPDYDKITDRWEYEDANEDFNEVAPTAPRGWEYGIQIAEQSVAQADAYRMIFDGFNDQARRANPFYFRDKWDQVWENVRIESYSRNHDAHKSWAHNVTFRLKTNTGTVLTAGDPGAGYIMDGGFG